MTTLAVLTPLVAAVDPERYGGKAAQLATALAQGLPVPGGWALDWEAARATAAGDPAAESAVRAVAGGGDGPWAVRSSAIGEDSEGASFAGAHTTVLGVVGEDGILDGVRRVHASASDPGALGYRAHLGIDQLARMGVVVQAMVAADVAGVLFTRNPLTGAAERVIEASWGLGESVVSGAVTPDQWRLDPTGRLLDHVPGEKDVALRLRADGGVEEESVVGDRVTAPCLSAEQLGALHQLALACDRAYASTDHDIEFAIAGGRVHLLQRRPITGG